MKISVRAGKPVYYRPSHGGIRLKQPHEATPWRTSMERRHPGGPGKGKGYRLKVKGLEKERGPEDLGPC